MTKWLNRQHHKTSDSFLCDKLAQKTHRFLQQKIKDKVQTIIQKPPLNFKATKVLLTWWNMK